MKKAAQKLGGLGIQANYFLRKNQNPRPTAIAIAATLKSATFVAAPEVMLIL